MTDRLRLGKMSIFMRVSARPLPTRMAPMAATTVMGRLSAKVSGFMEGLPRKMLPTASFSRRNHYLARGSPVEGRRGEVRCGQPCGGRSNDANDGPQPFLDRRHEV